MAWITFGTAVSPEPLSQLDAQFTNVAGGMTLPCTVSGTNALSLTPLANFPALLNYNELGGYRFRAVASSTGPVTAQFNGLGFLPVYHQDGVTQVTLGDIVISRQYILTFSQALNSNSGGYFLEDPSQPAAGGGGGGGSGQTTPGGRLTLVNSSPVMFSNQTGIQNIFYVPYQHPFIPLYNGTNVQMYNFTPSLSATTGLTLALGGAANFPNGAAFDVFGFLVSGNPTLVAVQWTNTTTRATTLAVFGGYLTNAGAATAQTGPNTSTTLPINQGTFLGSFVCSAQGACSYVFGGSASGGSAAQLLLCNYYNKTLTNTIVTDTGVTYTLTAIIRQARASAGNQIQVMQSDSERAVIASYTTTETISNGAQTSTSTGIGINSTTTFSAFTEQTNQGSASTMTARHATTYSFTATGLVTISANEIDTTGSSSSFDVGASNQLAAAIWL